MNTDFRIVPDVVRKPRGSRHGSHTLSPLYEALASGRTVFGTGWEHNKSPVNSARTHFNARGMRLVCRAGEVDGEKGIAMWVEQEDAA